MILIILRTHVCLLWKVSLDLRDKIKPKLEMCLQYNEKTAENCPQLFCRNVSRATWAFPHQSVEAKSFRSFHQIGHRTGQNRLHRLTQNKNTYFWFLIAGKWKKYLLWITKCFLRCHKKVRSRMLTCQSGDNSTSSSTPEDRAWEVCTKAQKITTTSWIFKLSISLPDLFNQSRFFLSGRAGNALKCDSAQVWLQVVLSAPAEFWVLLYLYSPVLLDPHLPSPPPSPEHGHARGNCVSSLVVGTNVIQWFTSSVKFFEKKKHVQ